ncbi:MAG: hypothetical protein ACE5I4_00690 [Thermoplasmata archaeon]
MGERQHVKRAVSLWVVLVMVLLAVAATAVGILTTGVTIRQLSLFETNFEASDFALTELELEIEGKNRVEVELVLTNTDSTPHAAEVTVQVLDSNGDVVMAVKKSTGTVAGGADWESEFVFVGPNMVNALNDVFVVVDQV